METSKSQKSSQRELSILDRIVAVASGTALLLLVLITTSDVLTRYLFRAGSIKLQELEWHLFAFLVLLPMGYSFHRESQVRIDIFFAKLSEQKKALIDILGCVLFLIPFSLLLIETSLPFVGESYRILERSPDPGGLPYRFIVKAVIPLAGMLLLIQALRHLWQKAAFLLRKER